MKKLNTDREILQALLDGEKITWEGSEETMAKYMYLNDDGLLQHDNQIYTGTFFGPEWGCKHFIYEEPKELMTFLEAFKKAEVGQVIKWSGYAFSMQKHNVGAKYILGFDVLDEEELNKKQWWIE